MGRGPVKRGDVELHGDEECHIVDVVTWAGDHVEVDKHPGNGSVRQVVAVHESNTCQ